jgi:hypothetical protein
VKTMAFWAFGVGVPDGWRVEANDRGLVAAEPSGAA